MSTQSVVCLLGAGLLLLLACGKNGAGGAAGSGATAGVGGHGGAGGGNGIVNCSPPSSDTLALRLTSVARGFNRPLLAKSPDTDTSRLFVAEQAGRIYVIENGTRVPTPFLDLTSRVTRSADEQGLLGLAFHPGYAQNGRLYVHYSTVDTGELSNGDTVVAEYVRSADNPNVADPTSARIVVTQSQPEGNHNGGALEFGPDGFLYIGLGDGGGGGDNHGAIGNGQSTSTLLGKILRIDVDGRGAGQYGIPDGNLSGSGVRPEIWDYGLRNPWRFSFDACTGDLWIGDVGQNAWEEIDFEPAGQGRKNYGWRLKEGLECYDPSSGCDPSGATVAPVAVYANGSDCSVTGGYVYRGSAVPALRGVYLYADYCSGNFWMLAMVEGQARVRKITSDINPDGIGQISSFGRDASGELYVVTFTDGAIYRIESD